MDNVFGLGKSKKKPEIGPVTFVIGGDPEKKIVIFQFGQSINRLEFSPEEALEIASNIMTRASIASGKPLPEMIAERQALAAARAVVGTPLSEERIRQLEAEEEAEKKS